VDKTLLWRHYFLDLPLFALGFRVKRLDEWDRLSGERTHVINGIKYLRTRLGAEFCPLPEDEIARRSHQVKLVRESDTFASLLLSRRNLAKWFDIEGLSDLCEALKDERPLVFLGGHMGSNYTMWIALDLLGYRVYPIARAVDRSPSTSRARRAYMDLTYWLTSKKWKGRYLLADANGHFPQGRFSGMLDDVFRRDGICFAAIDFPPSLYTGRQEIVPFLGGPAPLPVNFIRMGLKKNARFFTILEGIEVLGGKKIRHIQLQPIDNLADASEILRIYASRMTGFISREPWQWMGLAIAHQYHLT